MKCFFYVIFLIIMCNTANAQSMAINTTGATANTSSILDVSSFSKGVLIPRMTKAQKNAIATPAIGLLVYQALPDSVGFHYYNGSLWVWLNPSGGASNDWSLTGNAGTDTAINFIGTTTNMPLAFRVNNEKSGRLESDIATANTFLGNRSGLVNTGSDNTAFGFRALSAITSGSSNVAFGSRALENFSSPFRNDNIAIGYTALQNSNGSFNIGIGTEALRQSVGNANVAVGQWVLQNNSTGLANTGMGYYALRANTTGRSNIGIGMLSLYNNTSGGYNIGIGDSAAYSNTSGSKLLAIGSKALYANTTGTNLTALGDSALYSNTTGYKNIALGNSALVKNTTGFQNIGIGYRTLKDNQTGFANIAIGDSALSANTTNWNIAIGRNTLLETTTGDKNIAIGDGSLTRNLTGENNVAIGYGSQLLATSNNNNNTTLGFRSAWSMQGYSNVAIGGDAMGKPATTYTVNNTIAIGDSVLFNIATGASNNTAIGTKTLFSNTTGRTNTALGAQALYDNTTGNNNVAIGDSAAYNSNASFLTAVGSKALFSNTSGTQNVALGNLALYNNITGGANTGIGYRSLYANNGSSNTAIGSLALPANTTGFINTAVGQAALAGNTTGNSNTAIGSSALSSNIIGTHNVAIGESAAVSSNVSGIVAIGSQALYFNTTGAHNTGTGFNSLRSNTVGNFNTGLGYKSMYRNTIGSYNVAIGDSALHDNTTGTLNTAIGTFSMSNNTIASGNTAIGSYSLIDNISGSENTAHGYASLLGNSTGVLNVAVGPFTLADRNGSNNIAIGDYAGAKSIGGGTSFLDNIFIGSYAGFNSTGNGNIFIGDHVGEGSTAFNVLSIDNSNTIAPLILGNFATNLLRINGTLNINSQYSFPLIDGSANQVLYTNGAGTIGWANAVAAANNGLNVSGSIVKLGGTLLDSTTITQGSRSMVFDLNGTGDFYVRKNTTEDALMVKNTGFVGLNTNDPMYRLHIVNVSGGNGPFGRGIVIENTNTGSNGEASIAFKNSGPGSVAANSAWMSGLNNAANYVIAYGDSLKASNVKMKLDTLGNVSIGNQGSAAQSKLDVKGSFGNGINVISADYTANDDDHTIIIASSVGATPLTVTLPAASTCDRREYIIVNRNGSIKTVTSYNDFSGTSTAIPGNGSITLQSNGSNWFRTR